MTDELSEEVEFAGICRACGGNVNKIQRGDERLFACENAKCGYHNGEEIETGEPEWLD